MPEPAENPDQTAVRLSVTGLCLKRGDRILIQDLSLTALSGQAIHLHGPNGSGKTTLLRTLAGLSSAEAGNIEWCGQPIQAAGDEYRGQVAYVGHLNGLQPELNLVENLRFAAAIGPGGTAGDIERAIETVGLTNRRHLACKLLSQGQKRRGALARLCLDRRPLWLLDEPVTALDTESIDVFSRLLEDHLNRSGILVFTSHQPLPIDEARLTRIGLGQ